MDTIFDENQLIQDLKKSIDTCCYKRRLKALNMGRSHEDARRVVRDYLENCLEIHQDIAEIVIFIKLKMDSLSYES